MPTSTVQQNQVLVKLWGMAALADQAVWKDVSTSAALAGLMTVLVGYVDYDRRLQRLV
ncbi:hypothetical protein [Thermoleptolyngbya sp.]|jgi:hypothetical protein